MIDTPPTEGAEATGVEPTDWLTLARHAYRYSTSYIDTNYRKNWEDSIRAFNNLHPTDSKYLSSGYDKRSRVYRPKARSVIRKNEAAAAAAFFSNMDVISTEAANQADQMQRVSAEVVKELLQYRLTKSIPWFMTVLGGLQDAQTQGAVCAHVYWHYEESRVDKPCVDLIPLENLRIDPAASWVDPIGTSPYVIHLMPMYAGDVKQRMQVPDKRGLKWKQYEEGIIRQALQGSADTTRSVRNSGSDPTDESKPVGDYEIVWVQRHIHRKDGQDWHFYTLGEVALLSEPEALREVVFHGERPYVLGCAILETHKSLPSSIPTLIKPLIDEGNEVANQRLDNVKFVLNKRWFAKRGANVDLNSLVRNVPGGITLMDGNPREDIQESNWPDVTASSYAEQERIDNDVNELAGNFSPMDLPNRKGAETARGMQLLVGPSVSLTEYLLRTYGETFIEPVLRQLVKLEQYYETDETVLGLVAQKAKLFQRYGIDRITDEMLSQELTIKVNVGMGATDPNAKLQKVIAGWTAFTNIAKNAPPGMNVGEIGKEIAGFMGYQDGARFFTHEDPEKARLQAQLQQMQQMVQMAAEKLKEKKDATQASLQVAQIKARTDLVMQDLEHKHENRLTLAKAHMEQSKPAIAGPDPAAQMEIERAKLDLARYEADLKAQVEREKAALDAQTKREIAEIQARAQAASAKLDEALASHLSA